MTARNSAYSFRMSYKAFFALRVIIAKSYDEWFGTHYQTIAQCHDQINYEEHNRITEEILSHLNFQSEDEDIMDFLYTPDCDGKIGYRTCRKLYELVKDKTCKSIDLKCTVRACNEFEDFKFRRSAHLNNDFEVFKQFLMECYSHRRTAYWI